MNTRNPARPLPALHRARATPFAAAITAGMLLTLSAGALQASNAPTINLFPTTVVENLRESAATAKTMENAMAPLVQQMEEQIALYREAKCEGNDNDPGCAQIKATLGRTYLQMLDGLEAELPRIEAAMNSTRDTLAKRIRGKLGRSMTPRDMAVMVEGRSVGTQRIRQRSNRSRGRMSQMLGKYHKLVALGSQQGDPMPLLAMDIYLDAAESVDLIETMRAEINRSRGPLMFGEAWGFGPSDSMVATVDGVKQLLFGTEDEGTLPESSIQGREQIGFDDSDLRL